MVYKISILKLPEAIGLILDIRHMHTPKMEYNRL